MAEEKQGPHQHGGGDGGAARARNRKKKSQGRPVDPSLLGFSVKTSRLVQGSQDATD
ncbi:hypothetical protein Emag_007206 [Eimeria magna]